MENVESWQCHIHSSSSDCTIISEFDAESQVRRYYHSVPIKTISVGAQQYNVRKKIGEFWEDLGSISYFTPIAYANCISNPKIFSNICFIFKQLDNDNLKYSTSNSASDFIKKHIITDGSVSICLCNKHLLTQSNKTKTSKPQQFYTRASWIKSILKLLFPKIDSTKDGIPTNTPHWAISVFNSIKSDAQIKNFNIDNIIFG